MTETDEKTAPQVEYDDTVMSELAAIVGPGSVSDMKLERIVYSGDPSALPQYHYRWKRKYLADYVVRTKTPEQVQEVIKIAGKHKIPVIPRGGASSCLGSSSPTRGGISLDIKRMDQIVEINEEELYIRVEPGVPFERLETELAKKSLSLGIYPSSAKSAVIGGWIACGGKAGIGTPLNGGLKDNILELEVVKPSGELVTITGDGIELLNESYGILGVIVQAKIRIRKRVEEFRTISYSFLNLEHLCYVMQGVAAFNKKPIYLKIADEEFQRYSNPLEKGKFILSVTYPEDDAPLDELMKLASENGGALLDAWYAEKEWDLRYDCEFKPKEHCETLMFQEVFVDLDKVYPLLKAFEESRKSHKVPALWFGMLGTPTGMRVELMAMLDPDKYLKFIASKGILHKMMKKSISLGGGPYTIGLQNSIYMKRAYPERLVTMTRVKESWDPDNICNPDRVTTCMTSYARMNILFGMATKFRWLSKFIGR